MTCSRSQQISQAFCYPSQWFSLGATDEAWGYRPCWALLVFPGIPILAADNATPNITPITFSRELALGDRATLTKGAWELSLT